MTSGVFVWDETEEKEMCKTCGEEHGADDLVCPACTRSMLDAFEEYHKKRGPEAYNAFMEWRYGPR